MIFDGRCAHRAAPFIAAALSTASTIVW
jgi:hypothetical protein